MAFGLNPPLIAKNGHTLEVIIGGRVSDPGLSAELAANSRLHLMVSILSVAV